MALASPWAEAAAAAESAFMKNISEIPPFPLPIEPLSCGNFSGPARSASPDPLVRFVWDADCNYSALQAWSAAPVRVAAAPSGAAANLGDLVTLPFGASGATVLASSLLVFDWVVERAGWLELLLPPSGIPPHVQLSAGISEYNAPRPGSLQALTALGGGALRLVTNAQLYDGLRYAFLNVSFDGSCSEAAPCAPLQLLGVRAGAQVLPLNYGMDFASGDALLDRIVWTGAYAVRANLLPGFFGSELLDRSDRAPPFQGDAHVAQAVGLAAFASPPLYAAVRAMLAFTDSAARPVHDSNIATYPLQWVLSVTDYAASAPDGDAVLLEFSSDVENILDAALANLLAPDAPADLRWSGWDDRLGSGFSSVNQTPEARRLYWLTAVRAAASFARAAGAAGGSLAPAATKYTAAVAAAATRLRAAGVLEASGYHAAAAAINGGWLTAGEAAGLFSQHFNDTARACSLSNYDTGFLLDALGALGHLDFATAMLRMCWGVQLAAGASCWWESTFFYDGMASGTADMDLLPGASTSACHAWGAFPTAWAQRHLLGVAPTAQGFARFVVAPGVGLGGGGWLPRVAGAVPTPHGPVALSAVAAEVSPGEGAELRLQLTHPVATVAEVRLPAVLPRAGSGCPLHLATVALDGQTLPQAPRRITLPPPRIANADVHVLTLPGGGGERAIVVSYACADAALPRAGAAPVRERALAAAAGGPFSPYPPASWPAGSAAVDNATHGSWINAFGRDGYVLFGYAPGAVDVTHLPAYVANVSAAAPRRRLVGTAGSASPLQDPAAPGGERALGAAYAASSLPAPAAAAYLQDPAAPSGARALGAASASSLYSLAVDVQFAPGAPATNVSVYLAATGGSADGTDAGESVIVHFEDLATRNVLVPDVTLRRYVAPPAFGGSVPPWNAGGLWGLEQGVFLTVAYDAPLRIRIYCGAGCYSSVSAVFFDALAAPARAAYHKV